jgi:atypical dual specificity phosphatase
LNTKNQAALELDGFGVSFGQRVVLDGVTLSLPHDGVDVLMGPVKSGKSTLFRTLSGLYEGHALHKSWGNAAVLGNRLSHENRPRLVQQHAKTPDASLLQALLEPVRQTEQRSTAEWREAGLQWLAAYGLADFTAQADQPLLHCHTRVQRSVHILAQLLLRPSLLLIDEPTYGLKDADAAWMVDWLKRLSSHCRLWVVLHNQVQARKLADRIVLIGGGRLLTHQETLAFFKRPANEWVAQFIRTGGLTLPAPDARTQDLADDVAAPPPLSEAAEAAIQSFSAPPGIAASQKAKAAGVSGEGGSFHAFAAGRATVSRHWTKDSRQPLAGSERSALAGIPLSSGSGVELASAVGEFVLRDASAPRGFNWIVPGKLAGCAAPGVSAPIDYDLGLLARVGISRLITLTETDLDQEALRRHHLTNIHLSVFDGEAPSLRQTHMLLVRMQKKIEAGETLAVHCKAGLGRTGAILAAWMIKEGGLTAENSMMRLRKIDPGYIQSKGQEDFLHRYEADLTQRLI